MSTVNRILPCYTSDISGVCSALYELGGMVVMHDPSGCNSTYNTHDETRWYNDDSLIYISALTEKDAIFGDDHRFLNDAVDAVNEVHPEFVALVSAPIPWMNGTDFHALERKLQERTGIPAFYVKTSGMHDYVTGAGEALLQYAKHFVKPCKGKIPHSLNILGMTPLDFAPQASSASLKAICGAHGWHVISCWAMDSKPEELQHAASAEMNLVVSSVGLAAADYLEKAFGIPYVVGAPIGAFAETVFRALEEKQTCNLLLNRKQGAPEITLIGEPVTMGSLACAITGQYGIGTEVICPLERCKGLLTDMDHQMRQESDLEEYLKSVKAVIADPLYRYICPKSVTFYDLPQVAFSGRCYRKNFINLFDLNH